jgi:ribosomal protein L22
MSAENPTDPPEDKAEAEATPETPKAAKAAKAPKAAKAAKADKPSGKAAKAKDAQDASAGGEQAAAKKAPAKKAAKKAAAEKAPAAEKTASAEKTSETDSKPAKAPRGEGKAAATAPRRRVVHAHARYVRTSARKARMVCGHLRGKSVQEARAILAFTPREVARDWSKLLESAVANAESNHELLEDDLIVREAYADEGPTIKRFRPRAMGRATPIRKRTSHLTITLTPRPEPGNTKRHG